MVVKLKRPQLVAVPQHTFLDVAIDLWQLLGREPLQIETPQVIAVVLPDMDMACMLWKELQEGVVPNECLVLCIKNADGDLKLVEGYCYWFED